MPARPRGSSEKKEKFVIWKHPDGVVLNPPEYVLDDRGEVMRFDDEPAARGFLRDKGVPRPGACGIHITRESEVPGCGGKS